MTDQIESSPVDGESVPEPSSSPAATRPEPATVAGADVDAEIDAGPAGARTAFLELVPLTLDLVAAQLDRLGIKYNRVEGWIRASWPDYNVRVQVLPDARLFLQAHLSRTAPADRHGAAVAWCMDWNAKTYIPKASARVWIEETGSDERVTWHLPRQPVTITGGARLVCLIELGYSWRLDVGVAPVQLHSIVKDFLAAVSEFVKRPEVASLTAAASVE